MIATTSYSGLGYAIPIALLGTTAMAFHFFGEIFGARLGYLFGFLFYWTFWCLLIPFLIMSGQEIRSLFQPNAFLFNRTRPFDFLCLVVPLVFAYAYAFPRALHAATFQIILVSLVLAVINATMEELLWRGLYLKLFGSDKWLYILISSFGFAIWHFAPQLIFPNKAPGGQFSFVAVAFILGMLFSIVAYNTKSIFWVSICHILFDFSGLGGRIYYS